MTFTYQPDQLDFLNYLYYVTTKSKRVQRRRMLNKLVILFLYFIAGIFLYNGQGPVPAGLFFLLCLPMYFFYTYFEKRQYLKHFLRYIQAHFKDEIGKSTAIDLDEEGIAISIDSHHSKMNWSEVEQIDETGTIILVIEKNQNAIVIPKTKTDRIGELIAELKRIASEKSINYHEELDWKWK